MSNRERELFTLLLALPTVILTPLGMVSKIPSCNVAISNVPGMRQPMYWNGARLDGSYPMSIVADGMALNITLVTYDKNVDFGIIACRRSVPQVQRLIDYMEESLQELEDAAGLISKPAKKRSRGSTQPKTKTAPKAKPKSKRKAAPKVRPKAKPKAKSTTASRK